MKKKSKSSKGCEILWLQWMSPLIHFRLLMWVPWTIWISQVYQLSFVEYVVTSILVTSQQIIFCPSSVNFLESSNSGSSVDDLLAGRLAGSVMPQSMSGSWFNVTFGGEDDFVSVCPSHRDSLAYSLNYEQQDHACFNTKHFFPSLPLSHHWCNQVV